MCRITVACYETFLILKVSLIVHDNNIFRSVACQITELENKFIWNLLTNNWGGLFCWFVIENENNPYNFGPIGIRVRRFKLLWKI